MAWHTSGKWTYTQSLGQVTYEEDAMIKRPMVIVILAVIGVIALAAYLSSQPPQGVEAKGGVEAVSWITPAKLSGRPINRRSQSMTRVSSSVAAGLVCQSMALMPSPAESNSPRMEGPLLLAWK